MTANDLNKLFWIVKRMVDDYGHYLPAPRRRILHHALTAVLELRDVFIVMEEAKFFRMCHDCKRQMDIRKKKEYKFNEDGNIVHLYCPELRPDEERSDPS